MIFQFPSGLKDCAIRVYGYPGGTVSVDGVSHTMNINGYKDITVKMGSHTFVDGHVSGNSKTLSITDDCTVVVGLLLGSIGSSSSYKTTGSVHSYDGGENSGSSSISPTPTIPSGNIATISHAKVSGAVRSRQTHSGYNIGPACYSSGSISVAGTVVASRAYPSSPDLAYSSGYDSSRSSGWKSLSGTASISSRTSGSISASMSAGIKEDSGLAAAYAYTDYYASEIYVY